MLDEITVSTGLLELNRYPLQMYSIAPWRPILCGPEPLVLPMVGDTVHAGFPSPAEDFAVERLDLTTILVTHPQATFIVRLRGDSMREVGILMGIYWW